MVNNNLIITKSGQSLLEEFIVTKRESQNFIIEKNINNEYWYMKKKPEQKYGTLSVDYTQIITNYAKKIKDINFNSILISGLGMGVIPYLCQDTTQVVDVVEINSEVIEITTSLGHLNSNVNIIQSNIYEYVPNKTYDVILFDHWLIYAPEYEMNLLSQKYQSFLKIGGTISFPIHEQMFD